MALPQRKQNFMEGAAVLTLAVAVTKVLGAVYKIPLGNLLDKDGMAHFYVAYNIYSLLLIVSTAGLPLALSRLVSQAEARGRVNQRKRIFRVTLGLFCLLGVVCRRLRPSGCWPRRYFACVSSRPSGAIPRAGAICSPRR